MKWAQRQNNCSSKCAYDCAKLSVHNTAQNSSDNLPSYLQTIIIAHESTDLLYGGFVLLHQLIHLLIILFYSALKLVLLTTEHRTLLFNLNRHTTTGHAADSMTTVSTVSEIVHDQLFSVPQFSVT